MALRVRLVSIVGRRHPSWEIMVGVPVQNDLWLAGHGDALLSLNYFIVMHKLIAHSR